MTKLMRDNISQSGMQNKLKIDNRQVQQSSLLKKIVIGVLIGVIVAGIVYWIGWN